MINMITGKIDVKKIDKAKLYVGEKGTYLDVVLIDTPNGQYGDYMIVQQISKEEREKGLKGNILGNAKNIGTKQGGSPAPQQQTPSSSSSSQDVDLPF